MVEVLLARLYEDGRNVQEKVQGISRIGRKPVHISSTGHWDSLIWL